MRTPDCSVSHMGDIEAVQWMEEGVTGSEVRLTQGLTLPLSLASHVSLGKLRKLSEQRVPCVKDGGDNSLCVKGGHGY